MDLAHINRSSRVLQRAKWINQSLGSSTSSIRLRETALNSQKKKRQAEEIIEDNAHAHMTHKCRPARALPTKYEKQ